MKSNRNILVVDDSKTVVEGVVTVLQDEGYSVDFAYDGRSGLYLASRKKYFLIQSDWTMPDGNPEFMHRLAEICPDVPVIVLSTTPLEEVLSSVSELPNFAGYITKYAEWDGYLEEFRRIIGKRGIGRDPENPEL